MKSKTMKLSMAILLSGFFFFSTSPAFATIDELVIEEASIARFSGSWFQIGRQIGAAYPDYILEFSNSMKIALFFVGLGSGWNASTAQTYYDLIEDTLPQNAKDHMAGLAVGMTESLPISYETAWDAVVTQNMAVEMLNMADNMETIPDPNAFEIRGCTGLAVTSDNGTFLCHNTDATYIGGDNIVLIMYWEPDNGDYGYMTMDPPGWADVNYALNDQKIAITLNAGGHHTQAEIGMPINFMLRNIMEQASTLTEAISLLEDYLDDGRNFGIAGALLHIVDFNNSTMAKIQVMSDDLDITYGETSPFGTTYVASANHFVGDFVRDLDYDYPTSIERYQRLLELVDETEIFDLDACWNILKDTDNGSATNNTISRFEGSTATIFGNIFTEDGMYYTMGPPHAYLEKYGEPKYISFDEISTLEPRTFTATPKAFQVILEWEVHDKDSIKGYNLYRSNTQNGPYDDKINTELLTTTTYTDKWLWNRKRVYYKLGVVFNDDTESKRSIVNATPKLIYWF